MHAPAQVMQRLARVGRQQDYWVVNFGLHYSPGYRQELEQLVSEVFPFPHQAALHCLLIAKQAEWRALCSTMAGVQHAWALGGRGHTCRQVTPTGSTHLMYRCSGCGQRASSRS